MSVIHVVTDIDGTLGRTEAEILASLGTLRRLGSAVRVSFVTGRSLTALRPLASAFREGAQVSPWGGGNCLRRAGDGYRPVWPLAHMPATVAPAGFSWVHVPREGVFDHADERIGDEGPGEGSPTHVCVGGFREVTGLPASPVGVVHAGLDNTRWDLVTPWGQPRRELLRRMRGSGARWIAYWGDAGVDMQALGEADLVLAPVASALARHGGASSYASIDEAIALTLGAAPAVPYPVPDTRSDS